MIEHDDMIQQTKDTAIETQVCTSDQMIVNVCIARDDMRFGSYIDDGHFHYLKHHKSERARKRVCYQVGKGEYDGNNEAIALRRSR